MKPRVLQCLLIGILLVASGTIRAQVPQSSLRIFDQENLVAWCIVPFDAKQRSPRERVEMLKRIGFRRYAYDWRAEHLPQLAEEIDLLKSNGIDLFAVWFPTEWNADAQTIIRVLKEKQIHTQLWVMGGGSATKSEQEQADRVKQEARRIGKIADAAAEIGCQVGLYNHLDWFGEPENQLAIIEQLNRPNVGIVYNLHHGHAHLDRFDDILAKIKPHLLCINLNGMIPRGDALNAKILPLGAGTRELGLLQSIASSGYGGRIGIIGHTQDDAEQRLQDNLDGLQYLLKQLSGGKPIERPVYRTVVPALP